MNQYKLILIPIIILLALCSGYSQLSIHAGGGVDYTTVRYVSPYDVSAKKQNGYHLELNLKQGIGHRLNVNLGTQFVQRGFFFDDANGAGFKRRYIDIQPEVSLRVKNSVELGLGFYYGILTAAYSKGSGGPWIDLSEVGLQTENDYGLTFLLRNSYEQLEFHLRYKHGLYKLNQFTATDMDGNPLGEGHENNRQVQLGVAYRFDFNKKSSD